MPNGKRLTGAAAEEFYADVAEVYRVAAVDGKPLLAVMEKFGATRGQASQWVHKARRLGLLEATSRGRINTREVPVSRDSVLIALVEARDRIVLLLACPHCGAQGGKPCAMGRRRWGDFHKARTHDVDRLFRSLSRGDWIPPSS